MNRVHRALEGHLRGAKIAFEQVPLATRRIRIFGGTQKPRTWIVKVGLLSIGPILIDSWKAGQSPCIIKVLAKVFPNAAGSPRRFPERVSARNSGSYQTYKAAVSASAQPILPIQPLIWNTRCTRVFSPDAHPSGGARGTSVLGAGVTFRLTGIRRREGKEA